MGRRKAEIALYCVTIGLLLSANLLFCAESVHVCVCVCVPAACVIWLYARRVYGVLPHWLNVTVISVYIIFVGSTTTASRVDLWWMKRSMWDLFFDVFVCWATNSTTTQTRSAWHLRSAPHKHITFNVSCLHKCILCVCVYSYFCLPQILPPFRARARVCLCVDTCIQSELLCRWSRYAELIYCHSHSANRYSSEWSTLMQRVVGWPRRTFCDFIGNSWTNLKCIMACNKLIIDSAKNNIKRKSMFRLRQQRQQQPQYLCAPRVGAAKCAAILLA